MSRVAVQPELLRWARERARLAVKDLAKRFPKLAAWEQGQAQPTFRQLQDFAQATRVPFGYLFLPSPPAEPIPIPDFRTLDAAERRSPSPELLDTIYAMQRRQAWLREERLEVEADPLDFVGSAWLTDAPDAIGREMRRVVGFGDGWAAAVGSWQEAVGALRRAIEDLGVMAVINGVVGNNTHRPLDVEEFRGFALVDPYAPLIFVNGADARSAQMFTLAHELAHVWLGPQAEGVSGFEGIFPDDGTIEQFCDRAAAEFLIPARELKSLWSEVKRGAEPFKAIARRFKVSPIVAARRALDLRLVDRETFFAFYNAYTKQEHRDKQKSGGGDFYKNQNSRIGELFARSVVRAAKEGRIGFQEAYDLTGLQGGSFQDYAGKLGVNLP